MRVAVYLFFILFGSFSAAADLPQCLDAAPKFTGEFREGYGTIDSAKAAAKLVAKFRGISRPSCAAFHESLKLLVHLNAKGFLNEARGLLGGMAKTYRVPPKEIAAASAAVPEADEKLRAMVPNPVDFRDRVALIVYGWLNPKTVAALPQEVREPLYLSLLESLHHAGRTKWNAKLVKMLSEADQRKNLKWTAQVSEQLCVNLRDTGKVLECEAWVAKLEKWAAEDKVELPSLVQERARIHMEKGEIEDARRLYLKIVSEPSRYLSSPHMLPWVYFDMAMMEALDDKYEQSGKYLAEHTRLLEAGNPAGVSAWDRIPRRIMHARILIYTGKFDEARAELDSIETTTKETIRGMNATLIRSKFYRVLMAAAERDVKTAKRATAELHRMIEICPDPQVLIPWSNALVKAARNQYTEKDMEPMKKVIGPGSGRVRDIQYVMNLVKNHKPQVTSQ